MTCRLYVHSQDSFMCPYCHVNDLLQDEDAVILRQMNKAAQLTVAAIMDVPSVFSGQTFDTNT